MKRAYTIVAASLGVGLLAALAGKAGLAQPVPPAKESVLYTFQGGTDGGSSYGGLSVGIDGNLYGTTVDGTMLHNPANDFGTVFRLTTSGVKTVLHTFGGTDGVAPQAGVTFGPNGALYGVTTLGGSSGCAGGCGTIYGLFPNAKGTYTEQVMHQFQGPADGFDPISPLVMYKGALYGTTAQGGRRSNACVPPQTLIGCGTVFELLYGPGGWTKRTLYTFRGGSSDGAGPRGRLTVTSDGVYGTTAGGGNSAPWCVVNSGCGTVFLLTPTVSGEYKPHILYKFKGGDDGFAPRSGLLFTKDNRIIGLASRGGIGTGPAADQIGNGVVYALTPFRPEYMEHTLYSFKGLAASDGYDPTDENGLSEDESGDLYGTTAFGGDASCDLTTVPSTGCGVVFKLTPSGSGYNESVLYRFENYLSDGEDPRAAPVVYPGLIRPGSGPELYGTTFNGAVQDGSCNSGCGVVYKVTP